jgi:hypothetical protein
MVTTGGETVMAEKSGKSDEKSTIRTGDETSKSVKYSQEIRSTGDEPEREGRSLITTDHDVIRQWAEARDAVPATVEGSEHGDHLGVLRFDFGGQNEKLEHVRWDEWFATFDERQLNFIYQRRGRTARRATSSGWRTRTARTPEAPPPTGG